MHSLQQNTAEMSYIAAVVLDTLSSRHCRGFCNSWISEVVYGVHNGSCCGECHLAVRVLDSTGQRLLHPESAASSSAPSCSACLALQEALEEENKARIEQAKKMDLLIKRMDHTERARRENEAPLLQEAYAQKIKVAFFCLVGLMLHATE